jgi:hypothetical protein
MAFGVFKILKGLLIKEENVLSPKQIQILPGGTSGTTTTIVSSQTTDKSLTLPDATDTLTANAATQTLANKTLTAPVISTIVNSGTLTLPSSTDTLVGRNTTDTLANKTLNNTNIVTLQDNNLTIQDNSDNTKQLQFEVSGVSTATTRILSIPDVNTTIAGTDATQTLSNKTLTAPVISTIVNTGTLTLPTSTDTLVGRETTDTLSNKTLTLPVITSISNTGTLTLPTSTDTLVGRNTTDTLTNKSISGSTNTLTNIPAGNLTGVASISNGGTGQSTASLAFNALSPLTTKGDIVVHTGSNNVRQSIGSDNQVLVADSSQSNGLKWTTLQQGQKNYITYGDFENNATTGWSLAHTTISNYVPDQVSASWTAAAGTLSISTVSSGQLAGAYSLALASSTINTFGDMLVSQPYTIDKEDQAKVLAFKFSYSVFLNAVNLGLSGTFANTFHVYIYDVTNNVWIQPAGVYGMNQGTGVGVLSGSFQTPYNMTQFRLAFVAVGTGGGNFTIYLDDFSVGPDNASNNFPVADVGMYAIKNGGQTLSALNSDMTNLTVVRDSHNALNSSTGVYTIPITGWYEFGTRFTISSSAGNYGNVFNINGAGHTFIGNYVPSDRVSSSTLRYLLSGQTLIPGIFSSNSTGTITAESDFWVKKVTAPSGSDGGSRVVAAIMSGTPSGAINAEGSQVTAVYPSVVSDTHGSYNTGTGFYTAPVSGYYRVHARALVSYSTSSPYIYGYIYVNSTRMQSEYFYNATAGDCVFRVDGMVSVNAGDTISVRFSTNAASPSYVAGSDRNILTIERVSGPNSVSAAETIALSAYKNAGTFNAAQTDVTSYSGSNVDTHSGFNASTGVYTAPVSGIYEVGGSVSNVDTTTNAVVTVLKNGTAVAVNAGVGVVGAINPYAQASSIIRLVAGDTIKLQTAKTGSNSTFIADNYSTQINIKKIGN